MVAAGSLCFEFLVGLTVGSLGAGFAQDVVLFGAEEFAPFVIAFDDFAGGFCGLVLAYIHGGGFSAIRVARNKCECDEGGDGGEGAGHGMPKQANTNSSERKPIRRLVLLGAVEADVRMAERVEAVAEMGNDKVLAVAVGAQVTEDHLVELRVGDVAKQIGHLIIRQMPVQRTDALLGRPWAARVGIEQTFVVVGLDKQRVELAKVFGDAARDMAHVRGESDFFAAIVDHKTDRVDRIVLDCEARDHCIANLKFASGFEDFPCARLDAGVVEKFFRQGSRIDRHLVFSQEDFEAFDVIAVFVSEQDAVEAGGIDADRLHSRGQLFRAQTRIEHQPDAAALDHCRVATTATAKNRKTHRDGA